MSLTLTAQLPLYSFIGVKLKIYGKSNAAILVKMPEISPLHPQLPAVKCQRVDGE